MTPEAIQVSEWFAGLMCLILCLSIVGCAIAARGGNDVR